MSRKSTFWTGSTEGPEKRSWPMTWEWHVRERGCLHQQCGEEVIVPIGREMTLCFFHFWASPIENTCVACNKPHPRIGFGNRYDSHARTFGLFRSEDGPRTGEAPFRVVCRSCAHALWEGSEHFLDSLDR
jgi:hypothetical protein